MPRHSSALPASWCRRLPVPVNARPPTELEAVMSPPRRSAIREFLATVTGSVDRSLAGSQWRPNLADALAWVPGVTSSGAARAPVVLSFAVSTQTGSARSRMASAASTSRMSAPDHGVPLDPLAAERVEIVRGPATLRLAARRSVACECNIRPRSADAVTQPEGELVAGYGTVADSTDFSGQVNADAGSFGLHADAFVRRFEDYDTPVGRLDNSWVQNEGGALGATWFGKADDASRIVSAWAWCATNRGTACPRRRPSSTWTRRSC